MTITLLRLFFSLPLCIFRISVFRSASLHSMRPTISNLSLLSLILSTATAVPQHEAPVTTSAKAQSIPITKRSTFNPALLDPVDRWNMLKEGVARTQSKYNIFNAIPGLNATEVKPARRMMGRQRFKKSDIQMGTVPRDM